MPTLRDRARYLSRAALPGLLVLAASPSLRLVAAEDGEAAPLMHQATTKVGPARMRAALSRAVYGTGTAERLYLRLDLAVEAAAAAAPVPALADIPASAGAPARQRPPLSLVLLIDRSGSMAEEKKFEYALAAANLVVENLSDRDVVAIVAFSDGSAVLSPAGRVVNRAFLRHRLTDIQPRGWTNLSAGLLESFAQLDATVPDAPSAGRVRRVIVLTDGEANRGVVEPDRLRDLVTAARTRGIGVSTMGCGAEYNESVLRALATAGGGRYTYVAKPEQIPGAMAAELEGLLAVVAQNARLRLRVLSAPHGRAAGAIARVLGRPSDAPVTETTLDLGDLRERESGTYVLEITPPPSSAGDEVTVEAELTFDQASTATREQGVARVRSVLQGHPYAAPGTSPEDPSVSLLAAAFDALERAELAAAGLDEPAAARAESEILALQPRLRAAALERRDQELLNAAFLLKHLGDDIRSARASGWTHGHEEMRARLQKDADYRRYLLEHHR